MLCKILYPIDNWQIGLTIKANHPRHAHQSLIDLLTCHRLEKEHGILLGKWHEKYQSSGSSILYYFWFLNITASQLIQARPFFLVYGVLLSVVFKDIFIKQCPSSLYASVLYYHISVCAWTLAIGSMSFALF